MRRSSASSGRMYCPKDFEIARFRAADTPLFSVLITPKRGSPSVSRWMMSPEPSVLPSSTMMHSQNGIVWALRDSIASAT